MRLLHKKTLEFEWFLDSHRPPYLILSHRWLGTETTLQAFNHEKHLSTAQQSPGTAKVRRFCKEVETEAGDFVWVDTVCIDKTSSAELQEGINSMFKWYAGATRCYAYLDDVQVDPRSTKEVMSEVQKSRWWTRGWTLQELIAPKQLWFLNQDWKRLVSRDDHAEKISSFSGIQANCLFGDPRSFRAVPVAKRMSWMGRRETSRVEDQAYCLMGLFGVHMTMLYGEGENAFWRLQKTILEEIEDESILLWQTSDTRPAYWPCALAGKPHWFEWARNRSVILDRFFDREPIRMTTRGIELELYDKVTAQTEYFLTVPLNCLLDGERAAISLAPPMHMDGAARHRSRCDHKKITIFEIAEYRNPPPVIVSYDDSYHAQLSGPGHEVPLGSQYVRFKVYIQHHKL